MDYWVIANLEHDFRSFFDVHEVIGLSSNPKLPNNTLEVNSTGEVQATPDVAYLNFSLSSSGADASTAQSKNRKQLDAFSTAVENNGIRPADIFVSQFDASPTSESDQAGPGQSDGSFTVSENVLVAARGASGLSDKINNIFTAAAQNGLVLDTEQSGCFSFDPANPSFSQALDQAVSQGKSKAAQIAKAAGLGVSKLVSVQDYTINFASEDDIESDISNCKGPSPIPGTQVEPQNITVSLAETFQLK